MLCSSLKAGKYMLSSASSPQLATAMLKAFPLLCKEGRGLLEVSLG